MKTKADLQMRLAEIKIRGYIKDWEEYVLLYMIMTKQIDVPQGALFESKEANTDIRTGRGLFNPLRKIESPATDHIKFLKQHFPMFMKDKLPDVSTLKDWLYNDKTDATQWMELIRPTGAVPTI